MSCQEYGHRVLEAWLRDEGPGEVVFAPEPKRVRASLWRGEVTPSEVLF